MLHSKIEGEGKPLLILHGFLGMSDNWKTLANQYANEGFETHGIDLRNHGRSFHSNNFTYQDMVNDIVSYCQEKNLEKIYIIGHSMGGKVAMFLATQHPELIKKLLVADIGPKYYAPHHQDILNGLNAVDFSQKPGRSDVEEILKLHIPDFGTRQFLMKNLHWETSSQLAFRFNLKTLTEEVENIGEALPEEKKFNGETLFLRGEKSNYIKEKDFEVIKKHFPKAEIKTIANAGHWLHAENPKDFFEESSRFLM
ncbi:alpha/beta fold hydrolase [Flavobacterium sp. NST-5]|uniref:Alpha/beta fold hydrolase n=1 Tax=Flavobacterium ichthyis TaxID=2698827 RepID=A0ABW9ZA90_9FLAO|nr:alpha/beta fold hydrolase [Flavobacterium ichthyis]NBL65519.1 alpha/beta fold hydrolase [Flavobacterium ichthyis]